MHNPEIHHNNENIIRKAEALDLPSVSKLLKENLAKNLSEEDKKEGFFYFDPSDEDLEKIINDTGIYLSLKGEELKGYFMSMSKELGLAMPLFREMIEKTEAMEYDGKKVAEYKYVLLAQICIAKAYRGGMTFNRLHVTAQSMLRERGFEIGVGEVADTNENSLAVHRNLTDIGTYDSASGIKWHVLVSDLRKD